MRVGYEDVESKVLTIQNQQVIIDRNVADLYGVETKKVNQAVRNNPEKFPNGYILTVNNEELDYLRSKIDRKYIIKIQSITKSIYRT